MRNLKCEIWLTLRRRVLGIHPFVKAYLCRCTWSKANRWVTSCRTPCDKLRTRIRYFGFRIDKRATPIPSEDPDACLLRRGRGGELLEARIIPERIEHWIEPEQRGSERHSCTQGAGVRYR